MSLVFLHNTRIHRSKLPLLLLCAVWTDVDARPTPRTTRTGGARTPKRSTTSPWMIGSLPAANARLWSPAHSTAPLLLQISSSRRRLGGSYPMGADPIRLRSLCQRAPRAGSPRRRARQWHRPMSPHEPATSSCVPPCPPTAQEPAHPWPQQRPRPADRGSSDRVQLIVEDAYSSYALAPRLLARPLARGAAGGRGAADVLGVATSGLWSWRLGRGCVVPSSRHGALGTAPWV